MYSSEEKAQGLAEFVIVIALVFVMAGLVMLPGIRTFGSTVLTALNTWWTIAIVKSIPDNVGRVYGGEVYRLRNTVCVHGGQCLSPWWRSPVPLSAKYNMNVSCRESLLKLEIQGSLTAQDISNLESELADIGFQNVTVSQAAGRRTAARSRSLSMPTTRIRNLSVSLQGRIQRYTCHLTRRLPYGKSSIDLGGAGMNLKAFLSSRKGAVEDMVIFCLFFVFVLLPVASSVLEMYLTSVKCQEIKDAIDMTNIAAYNALDPGDNGKTAIDFNSSSAQAIYNNLLALNLRLNPDLTPQSDSIADGPVVVNELTFYTSGFPCYCPLGKLLTRPTIHTLVTVPVKPSLYSGTILGMMGNNTSTLSYTWILRSQSIPEKDEKEVLL